jgi:methylated-DNA-[protein]-cysteine S-methyltransferase
MSVLQAVTTTTPAGHLSLLAHDGQLVASGFTADVERLRAFVDPALASAGWRRARDLDGVTDVVGAYFEGDLAALDTIDAEQPGTSFQRHGWTVMRAIRPGEPVTYAEFARMIGRPNAIRAAGSVCARNALAPFVPCHRVVPSGGGVGNYGYGPAVKEWLLAHERRHAAA